MLLPLLHLDQCTAPSRAARSHSLLAMPCASSTNSISASAWARQILTGQDARLERGDDSRARVCCGLELQREPCCHLLLGWCFTEGVADRGYDGSGSLATWAVGLKAVVCSGTHFFVKQSHPF